MPSFQLCRSTGQRPSNLIRFGCLHFRDNWGWPCTVVPMWLICLNMQWWDCSSLSPLLCLQRQIAKLAGGLFCCWSLLGGTIPLAPNHDGFAESPRRAPKSLNSLTSTFFNTVHLLPKDLRFEHGGAKLACFPGLHLTSLRHWCRRFEISFIVWV